MDALATIATAAIRPPARINSPCPQHPAVHRLACDPCLAAMDERSQRSERADAISQAGAACDRRFPARYRHAVADDRRIADWVDAVTADPAAAGDLLLLGPVGTGKTYQAFGAIRGVATTPRRSLAGVWLTPGWRAGTHADIAASMRPGHGVDGERVMGDYRSAPLLLIDDLAMAKDSEWFEEITYRLISARYNDQRPTIFTTNLRGSEIRDALGDRIASRLAQSCQTVSLTGPDRRRQPRSETNPPEGTRP